MQLKNPKHERFCQIYVKNSFVPEGQDRKTLAEMYLEAGYSPDDPASAPGGAATLLRKWHIQMRIKELRAQRLSYDGYSQLEIQKLILDQLVNVVNADPTDIMQLVTSEDTESRNEMIREIEAEYGDKVMDFGNTIALQTPMLSRETASAIKSFKVRYNKATGTVSGVDVQLYDKLAAADKLAEVAGLKSNNAVLVASAADIANDPDAIRKGMEVYKAIKRTMGEKKD